MRYLVAYLFVLISTYAHAECASRVSTVTEGDTVVSTHSVVICQDGHSIKLNPRYKVGDSVLENELPKIPQEELDRQKAPAYFKHQGSKCRLFRERYMLQAKVTSSYGVLCQLDPNSDFWQIVDKW